MKAKLRKLNKKYNTLVKKAMSKEISDVEYEIAIDKLQSLEIEIFKLQLAI